MTVMENRVFQMRLNCSYKGPENKINQLNVEVLNDGEWQSLDLNIKTPGFMLFNYGLFSCQHLYFRTNAAERDLVLASSEAQIVVETDDAWNIHLLHIEFNGVLKSGSPTKEAIDYINERMGCCPVSSNMKDVADSKRVVTFECVT